MAQTANKRNDSLTASEPVPTTQHKRPGLRLAILAGALLWLACPPVALWPLAWVAVAPLIVSVAQATRLRQALWRGYVFGWVYLGPVWYWIGLTISGWLDGSPLGWLAWFGLTLILAGFYAAWGGAAWWLARRASGGWRLAALAAAWVIMEWARTLGALTMPWAQLSYTQYRFLPILQLADITGAYGVSFLLLLVNGAVAFWWIERGQPHYRRYLWGTLTLTVFACLYGVARLAQPEAGKPLRVAMMQGDFGVRANQESLVRDLRIFVDLTRQAAATSPPPSLYVWPESASPGDALDPASLVHDTLTFLARDYHAAVLVGSRVNDPQANTESASSVLFLPDGSAPIRYNKQQLVPFGEFIPYRSVWPAALSDQFQFFKSDVIPGTGPTVLRYTDAQAGTVALGPFICYESMYPDYAREMTRSGATLLVTQSNDAWFRSTAAMEQHLAAVVLRAIENRREVVRSTNNGITCVLDSKGRIVAQAPIRETAFLNQTVLQMDGISLYTRFGDWFVAACVLLAAGAVWHGKYRRGEGVKG